MLNFSYRCLYDLLSTIPSLTDPNVTVMDEIKSFNSVPGNKTHANARIVRSPEPGESARPVLADDRDFGLGKTHRLKLMEMVAESEKRLQRKTIAECFEEGFFQTNFWYMWATMCVHSSLAGQSKIRKPDFITSGLHSSHGIALLSSVDTFTGLFMSSQESIPSRVWIARHIISMTRSSYP